MRKNNNVSKPRRKAPVRTQRKPLNWKPARRQKEARPGTKRAKVLRMLQGGTTLARICSATGWDSKTAYDGLRLINRALGYGITESKEGKLRARG